MACLQNVVTTNTTNPNTIAGQLRKIDQMQKEAILANANALCDACLMSRFNTKPISLYVRGQLFSARIGLTTNETIYFRVEEVRGNDTVILRLLVLDGTVLTCTAQTVIVNIDCICSIQCYPPINCPLSACPCGITV